MTGSNMVTVRCGMTGTICRVSKKGRLQIDFSDYGHYRPVYNAPLWVGATDTGKVRPAKGRSKGAKEVFKIGASLLSKEHIRAAEVVTSGNDMKQRWLRRHAIGGLTWKKSVEWLVARAVTSGDLLKFKLAVCGTPPLEARGWWDDSNWFRKCEEDCARWHMEGIAAKCNKTGRYNIFIIVSGAGGVNHTDGTVNGRYVYSKDYKGRPLWRKERARENIDLYWTGRSWKVDVDHKPFYVHKGFKEQKIPPTSGWEAVPPGRGTPGGCRPPPTLRYVDPANPGHIDSVKEWLQRKALE